MSSPAAPADDAIAPLALRDRHLGALLASPRAALQRLDDEVAVVRMGLGDIVALITADRSRLAAPGGLAALGALLDELTRALDPWWGDVRLVVVGAGPEVDPVLRRPLGFWRVARFGLHRIDPSGRLHRVQGRLGRALARAAASADGAPVDLDARVARARRLGDDEQRYRRWLRGQRPVATAAIAILGVALFALGAITGRDPLGPGTADASGALGWARGLAAAFAHTDGRHLFLDVITVAIFGRLLESELGTRRFVVVYGLAALGGALAARGSGTWAQAGAAAPTWTLIVLGVALVLRTDRIPPLALSAARRPVAANTFFNLLYATRPAAHRAAEIAGVAVGVALLAGGLLRGGRSPGAGRAWTAAAIAVAIGLGSSLAVAVASARAWSVPCAAPAALCVPAPHVSAPRMQ